MITILTERRAYAFESDDWARDESGDVHVYEDDATLATFDCAAFVGVLNDLDDDAQRDIAATHANDNDQ